MVSLCAKCAMNLLFQQFLDRISTIMRRVLVKEGPVQKPEVLEKVDGIVKEVSAWESYKEAKEAKVMLGNGSVVSVFVPLPCPIQIGDCINVSVMGTKGEKHQFYVYRKHQKTDGAHNKTN